MKTIFQRIVYAILFPTSFLPLPLLFFLSDIVFFVLYQSSGYRKVEFFGKMQRVFPKMERIEIMQFVKGFFRFRIDRIAEMLFLHTASEKRIKKRFTIKNPDLLSQFTAEKRNVILYSPPFANMDFLLTLPMFIETEVIGLYCEDSECFFENVRHKMRERFDVFAVERKKIHKALQNFDLLNIPTTNIIPDSCSQTDNSRKFWTNFLGQEFAFGTSVERLAKRMDQVVIFPRMERTDRGRYELEFVLLSDNVGSLAKNELITRYAQQLEYQTISAPELLNWEDHFFESIPIPQDSEHGIRREEVIFSL